MRTSAAVTSIFFSLDKGILTENSYSLSVVAVFRAARRAVIWDAAGARTGWGREAVSAVAQKLLEDLADGINLK